MAREKYKYLGIKEKLNLAVWNVSGPGNKSHEAEQKYSNNSRNYNKRGETVCMD
jgi:hypothetical protein